MDERAARDVLAIRAIETTDAAHAVLDDAAYREASLSARRQVQLGASGDAAAVTPDAFLARRADLLLTDLATRTPGLAAWRKPLRWPTLLVIVLPVIALISGMLTESRTRTGWTCCPCRCSASWAGTCWCISACW
jgi:hypothetical protein